MTITITEKEIKENKDEYPDRKVKDKTFDDQVMIDDVDGFDMIDCTFTFDEDRGEGERYVLQLEKCENIRLTNCHFPKKEEHLDVVFLDNCKKITIEDCDFEGKTKKGNFIDIKGNDSSENRIEGCKFKNHSYSGDNGGEAIIIGRGEPPEANFNTHVTGCTFTKCNGDVEVISIKSSHNEIVDNTFEDWKQGNVSIRYGNSNTIQKNTFKGSGGGIVVRGKNNKILDNTHVGNNNTDEDLDFRPLTIENGGGDYAQAKDNTIDHNTYDNCEGACIVLGQEKRSDYPEGNTFKHNIVIADSVDSTFLVVPEKFVENDEKREKIIKENTFENNELKGKGAKQGALPKEAFK